MKFTPYLSFEGNAEDALSFYANAFNGTIDYIMRYSEMPIEEGSPPIPDSYSNKVLHATLRIGNEVIYLSDAFPGMTLNQGNSIDINITPKNEEELRTIFEKLEVGGTVTMPVEKVFWGSLFGSLIDKYGNGWNLEMELSSE